MNFVKLYTLTLCNGANILVAECNELFVNCVLLYLQIMYFRLIYQLIVVLRICFFNVNNTNLFNISGPPGY